MAKKKANTQKRYTEDQKKKAIAEAKKTSVAAAARTLKASPLTVKKWVEAEGGKARGAAVKKFEGVVVKLHRRAEGANLSEGCRDWIATGVVQGYFDEMQRAAR